MTDLPPLATVPGASEDLVEAASAAIRAYCGWHIAPDLPMTLTLDGPGRASLMLPSLYVQSVSAVASDGVTVAEYEWSANGFLRICGPWSRKLRGVVVTLTHGYDVCPADVAQVLAGLVAAGTPAAAGRLRQVGQVIYDTTASAGSVVGLTDYDRAILDHYRLPFRP